MKIIKDFLRKIDVFGVTFNFKYKSKDKYSTSIGGLFVFLFSILACYMGIYYFIPFYQRKNFTILYYTMNLNYTETIKLKEANAAFAIGLNCDEKEGLNITESDVFNLEIRHIIYTKDMEGKIHKNKNLLPNHPCSYADFYYKYNDSVDYLGLKNYQCLDDYSHLIRGIYSDQIFSYYEFTVLAKDLKNETFNKIDEYLLNTDCKLQIYYTDITINLDNYKQPISTYLNSFFIQLDPTLFIKRNMYYMNQYLSDDDLLFGVFGEETAQPIIEILYSRYEEYSLYLGLNRSSTRYPNYENYAKVYLRADTKKTEIRRTYQKIVEFFAAASPLLVALYELLIIIFNFIDNFYAEYSLGKKIFFFKELDDNHFHISKKYEQIKELLSLNKNKKLKKIEINTNDNLSNEQASNDAFHHEIFQCYKKNKNLSINKNKFDKIHMKGKSEMKMNRTFVIKKKNMKISDSLVTSKEIEEESKIKNSNILLNLKQNPIIKIFKNKNDNFKIDKAKINKNQQNDINYSFNVLEIILNTFCSCLVPKNLGLKVNLKEKANNILNDKLDIILYVRNMILFDIINETILSESKKDIINFLCRPTLSTNKVVKNKFVSFYQSFKENDFEKFSIGYKKLLKQTNKKEREFKLISFTENKLKDLIEEDKPSLNDS